MLIIWYINYIHSKSLLLLNQLNIHPSKNSGKTLFVCLSACGTVFCYTHDMCIIKGARKSTVEFGEIWTLDTFNINRWINRQAAAETHHHQWSYGSQQKFIRDNEHVHDNGNNKWLGVVRTESSFGEHRINRWTYLCAAAVGAATGFYGLSPAGGLYLIGLNYYKSRSQFQKECCNQHHYRPRKKHLSLFHPPICIYSNLISAVREKPKHPSTPPFSSVISAPLIIVSPWFVYIQFLQWLRLYS